MARTKRNARKNKRKPPLEVESDLRYYYPLFSGWTQEIVPLFKLPSQALCWQLSRFFKDSICHSWPFDHYPKWLSHIGGVLMDARIGDESTDVSVYKINFASSIEKCFFEDVGFFYYTGARASSIVLECNQELFSACRNLFKSHPDYQSSSTSIFAHKSSCRNVQGIGNASIASNLDGIPRPRCPNNLMNIGRTSKAQAKLRLASDIEEISKTIARAHETSKKAHDSIVISLGCGTGATELSSTKLCLCLDCNRRSLFAGVVNLRSLKGSEMVFAYFDFGKDLYKLLECISSKTDAKLQVLFQHPSPSPATKKSLSSAGHDCARAMCDGLIFRVDLVFDHEPTRNTWNAKSLLDTFFSSCPYEVQQKICSSESVSIANIDCSEVDHPVFGDTSRLGWAKMRKGTEQWIKIKLR